MSIQNSLPLMLGSSSDYTVGNSLRFRSSASAYLSRTSAVAGNRKTWTWSGWVKRGSMSSGTYMDLFGGQADHLAAGHTMLLHFEQNTERLSLVESSNTYLTSTAAYRDTSAWYHIVCAWDTTQTNSADRIKFYVNGTRLTSFATTNYPALNYDGAINNVSRINSLGCDVSSTLGSRNFFDGYMADVFFIDGQALTPSAFAESDSVTGQWKPKKYTGTAASYGTNGFHLEFTDTTANTAAGIGKDTSGKANNYTPTNISLTAGVTYDSMYDSPNCNYSVLNQIDTASPGVLTYGSLRATGTGNYNSRSTFSVTSGKWYMECTTEALSAGKWLHVGIFRQDVAITTSGWTTGDCIQYRSDGERQYNGVQSGAIYSSYVVGDIISVLLDCDGGTVTFWKNGTAVTGLTGLTLTGQFYTSGVAGSGNLRPISMVVRPNTGCIGTANFGQRPYTYTPPSGYQSLHSGNLSATIAVGNKYMQAYTYTGNGGGLQVGEPQHPTNTYQVPRSLRFRSKASEYLSRTFPTIANNQKTTFSVWFKRSSVGTSQTNTLLSTDRTCVTTVEFVNDKLRVYTGSGPNGQGSYDWTTTASYKDTTKWYHLVVSWDTTQATATDRLKIYIDGAQVTSFSSQVTITQNMILGFTGANVKFGWCGTAYAGGYFDGYLAEMRFIEGQALSATSFGTFDSDSYWTPIAYTGTIGANDIYLPFTPGTTAYAAAFTGSTTRRQYLKTPANTNLEFGSNDFTIEFWWYPTSTSRQGLYHGSFGTDWSVGIDYNGVGTNKIGIWASSNGTSWNLVNADGGGNGIGTTTITQYAWTHIAYVRSGSTFQLYINGTRELNLTSLTGAIPNRSTSMKAIGCWWSETAMNQASGKISNFRIVNGSAVYTANFTPSTSALTAITNTALLTLQDSTIVDKSANAATITNVNGVVIMPIQPGTTHDTSTIANDFSGNGNNLTPNRVELSSTINDTYDVMFQYYVADNTSDSGTYTVGTITYDFGYSAKVIGASIYSTYGGGLRSANITVQYSDDNATWTTAWTGVMSNYSSFGICYCTTSDTSAVSAHRYWRYVEGTAVTNHHPRSSRIMFTVASTNDSMIDSPTNYSDGSTTYNRGSYPVLIDGNGFLDLTASSTIVNAGLTTTVAANNGWAISDRDFIGGKYYCEVTYTGGVPQYVGIKISDGTTNGYMIYRTDNNAIESTDGGPYTVASPVAGDTIGIAIDQPSGSVIFYKNGTLVGTYGFPKLASATSARVYTYHGVVSINFNFGQSPFKYTPPTGYLALNTYNITEVTTDLEKPDLVWIKSRSTTGSHYLFDSGRGVTKSISTDNIATTQTTDVNSLQQFNKNGFLLGSSTSVNTSGTTYAAWAWKKGATPGFDVVTFQGAAAGVTINHSLGVAPSMVVVRGYTSATNGFWVYHTGLTTPTSQYLALHQNGAVQNLSWGGTPTSTTFPVANAFASTGVDSIAYLWSEVAGYSKFGKYTGNGSAEGPFVYCGFRPKFVMVKSSDSAQGWWIQDSVRSPYNQISAALSPHTNLSETGVGNWAQIDYLSNGFKLRGTDGFGNGNGTNYVFCAFAEAPFKYASAR